MPLMFRPSSFSENREVERHARADCMGNLQPPPEAGRQAFGAQPALYVGAVSAAAGFRIEPRIQDLERGAEQEAGSGVDFVDPCFRGKDDVKPLILE
jgi:hypothetical protein